MNKNENIFTTQTNLVRDVACAELLSELDLHMTPIINTVFASHISHDACQKGVNVMEACRGHEVSQLPEHRRT